jgi:hypothetical protein
MIPRFLALAALCVALTACPDAPVEVDGGVDAGVEEDAGTDAGGGLDAGELPDAGPPPELKLQKVLPPRSPTTGGVQTTFQGSGFVRGTGERATEAKKRTTVKFGSNIVQDFQVIDDGVIDVRVPPGKAGPTNVTIENDNGLFVCTGCFTYFEEVLLKTVSPKEGPLRGGTEVTLTGAGFSEDIHVLFGTQSVAEPFLVSATEMRVVAPRGLSAGPVDITVYSKNGVGVQRNVFRYHDDLRISDIAPLTGPLAGGTEVTLTGTGFTGATAVRFGGADAVAFTVVDEGTLTATVPARAQPGAVAVTVVTPRDEWTVKDGFTYVAGTGFALYGVFPHLGPASGGNTVTVTGEGLDAPGVTVSFGGAEVTPTSASANEAQVVVPARASGRKVDVGAQDGVDAALLPQHYTYRLALSGIDPVRGPIGGGTVATVSGSALPADAQVHVGARAAAVSAVTATSINLTTPKGQGGAPTAVRVYEAADPQNEALLPAAFTFDEALSVGGLQPNRGAIAGGTLVSVLGAGFGEGTIVRIGGQVAKDIKVVDSHTLSCRTPKGDVGSVDVRVERAGQTDVLEGGFSYFDPRSISGGLSGGPLTGTLNITVLDQSPGFQGAPVPLATVMLGVDPHTPFQGVTDHRGQITYSDPSLVKAQTVTAFKEGYASVTVTSVNAENLTVYIARVGGDGSPGSPPPGPPPSVISGRVTGFKAPRPLNANETLEARVFVSQTSLFGGAPFRAPPNRQGQKWQVVQEAGEYLVLTTAGLRAVYAVLGIYNHQTQDFEPHLMGVKRGVTVSSDKPATNQDIVLDMHLDMVVPVTVDQPISFEGMPASNGLYGWLDLGAEGFIPNPHNWGAGTTGFSSITSPQTTQSFPHFPRLDGSNFIFMNLSIAPAGLPYSIFFRRQPGDLAHPGPGLTIGPMLPTLKLTHPVSGTSWNGTVTWTRDPGPLADLHYVLIIKPTLMGPVTLWSMVLPGSDTGVTLPPAAVQKLKTEEAGNTLVVQILSSRSPKFSYNQWTYETLSGVTWSSFTVAQSGSFLP